MASLKNNLKEIYAFQCHSDVVSCVAFSPDGNTALSGSHDCTVQLLDLGTGRVIHSFHPETPLRAVAFAEDGRRVVTFSDDKIVRTWDLTSFELTKDFPILGRRAEYRRGVLGRSYPTSAAFSPDGNHILVGCQDRIVYLFSILPRTRSRRFIGHELPVFGVGFAGKDGPVYSFSQWPDTTLRIWDIVTRKEVQCLKHDDHILSATLSADGHHAVTGLINNKMYIWDTLNGKLLFSLPSGFLKNEAAFSLNFCQANGWLISGSFEGTIRLWDIETRKQLGNAKGHIGVVSQVAFSPEGHFALSCGQEDHTVKYWKLPQES